MPPISVAIIGLGHIGKIHIQAIQTFEELTLLAVCDRNSEYEDMAPDGVAFYNDFQELLKDTRIETIIVATPNHTHFYIAMSAIRAGKHVIVEKPAAETMGELKELEKAAEKSGVSIYYAFHAATAFDVTWTYDYLQRDDVQSDLGKITAFSARFYDPYIQHGVLQEKAKGLQHCWLDSGINALSVISRFIDLGLIQIRNVSAAVHPNTNPGILQCMVEYEFPIAGLGLCGLGVIDTNWTTGRDHKSTDLFFGESHCVIRINHSEQKVTMLRGDGSVDLLADLSKGRERLFNHYFGVFSDFIRYKQQQSNIANKMNSKESLLMHERLFQADTAIKHSLYEQVNQR